MARFYGAYLSMTSKNVLFYVVLAHTIGYRKACCVTLSTEREKIFISQVSLIEEVYSHPCLPDVVLT